MLKKLVVLLIVAIPVIAVNGQAPVKIGNINTQVLFEQMPEKKAGEKRIEDLSKKYETELVKMQEELKKKYSEFMAEQDTIPETIKTRRMQAIQELDQRVQNFQQTAYQSIQKEQEALISPITEKIKKAIREVASEKGFDYIFDLASPSVLFTSDKAISILPDVKAKLGLK